MASCRVAEDGSLLGPWLANVGEGSSLWGWSDDEETLPSILPEEGVEEIQVPVKGITGPWTIEDSNLFVESLWTPLRSGLGAQETLEPVIPEVPVMVDVQINTDPVDSLNPSRPLLGVTGPHQNEPSHIHKYIQRKGKKQTNRKYCGS